MSDTEFRVEVQNEDTGEWYPFDGSIQRSIEMAEAKLADVRDYYIGKAQKVRIAEAEQVWKPVKTKLELAVERLQAAMGARAADGYVHETAITHYGSERTVPLMPEDIRLLLNTVKEAQAWSDKRNDAELASVMRKLIEDGNADLHSIGAHSWLGIGEDVSVFVTEAESQALQETIMQSDNRE